MREGDKAGRRRGEKGKREGKGREGREGKGEERIEPIQPQFSIGAYIYMRTSKEKSEIFFVDCWLTTVY